LWRVVLKSRKQKVESRKSKVEYDAALRPARRERARKEKGEVRRQGVVPLRCPARNIHARDAFGAARHPAVL
jgi:hypothetical protein